MKLLLVLALLPSLLVADDAKPTPQKFLSLGKIKPVALKSGKTVEAAIPVEVVQGFHVQANPASNPQLIPTKIEVTPSKTVSVGEPIYPPGKPYRLQNAAIEIATYEGKFEIKVPLTLKAGQAAGKESLTGSLKFQACNDKICFFPSTVPVTIPVVKK